MVVMKNANDRIFGKNSSPYPDAYGRQPRCAVSPIFNRHGVVSSQDAGRVVLCRLEALRYRLEICATAARPVPKQTIPPTLSPALRTPQADGADFERDVVAPRKKKTRSTQHPTASVGDGVCRFALPKWSAECIPQQRSILSCTANLRFLCSTA